MTRWIYIGLLGFFLSSALSAQEETKTNLGLTAGLSFTLGTKINRLGLKGGLYYAYDFVQVNWHWAYFYSFNSWGPDRRRREWQMSLGLVAGLGTKVDRPNRFISPVSNQTGHAYSIAYAYKWYLDNISTTQKSGILALQFNRFSIVAENDAFIGKGTDKFRTGTILFQYRMDSIQVGLNTRLWTGDPKYQQTKRVKGTDYPSQHGYFDLGNALYGNYSHGITTLQVQGALPFNQFVQGAVGIDAEQIRHFVQNKLIHDMPFFPKRWNKTENPHFPMLQQSGEAYLFEEDERIRKMKVFGTLSLNPTLFY